MDDETDGGDGLSSDAIEEKLSDLTALMQQMLEAHERTASEFSTRLGAVEDLMRDHRPHTPPAEAPLRQPPDATTDEENATRASCDSS